MEGLVAFILESMFLGLWLFGRDRLPKRVHLEETLRGLAMPWPIRAVPAGTAVTATVTLAYLAMLRDPRRWVWAERMLGPK
jgi:hypothetical protein